MKVNFNPSTQSQFIKEFQKTMTSKIENYVSKKDSIQTTKVVTQNTYSKNDITQYGSKFTSLLEEFGYFDTYDEKATIAAKHEISNSIYNYNVKDKVSSITAEVNRSVEYMKSFAVKGHEQDLNDFIAAYQASIMSKVTETQANKLNEQQNEMLSELNEFKSLLEQAKNSASQAEAMSETFKTLSKCFKIAASMMHGDHVTYKDENFLMENQPDLYKIASLCRATNKDPKDLESISEEDEENGINLESFDTMIDSVDQTIESVKSETVE